MRTNERLAAAQRWLTLGVALGLVAWPGDARAQAVYTGAEIKVATEQSLDVMRQHVRFLSTQDRYDAMLGYYTISPRFAPLTYANADGTRSSSTAYRTANSFGFGYGSTSGAGFYVGGALDLVKIGPARDTAMEGFLFMGVAVFGFQLSYGGFVNSKLGGLDPYGNFNPKGGGNDAYTYVPGKGIDPNVPGAGHDAFAIYHTSGASLFAVRYDYPYASGERKRFDSVRAELQPLRQWLDSQLGLPMIALQRVKSSIDGFSSQKDVIRSWTTAPVSSGSQQASDELASLTDKLQPAYEFEAGSDNLLDQGIRAHGVVRVGPAGVTGRGEAGMYRDTPWGTAAFRTFVWGRDGSVTASLDSFVQWDIIRAGKPGEVGVPVSLAASYSYNSPESTTFLPLPYAHVFGFQFILGVPEVARRLVPIIRPKEKGDASSSKSSGGSR